MLDEMQPAENLFSRPNFSHTHLFNDGSCKS